MNHSPVLSICIPTYNGAKYIAQNLDIIIRQIIQDDISGVEIVISDNCSTDETPSLIAEYIAKHPEIVRYSRNEKNILFNGNILKCCELAKGEYIHFLGDDDFYCESGLKKLVEVTRSLQYDVIMVSNNWLITDHPSASSRNQNDHEIFGEDVAFNDRNQFIEKMYYRIWCASDIVIRRSLTHGMQKHLPPVADWIQIGIVSYVASRGGAFYCFSSSAPIITIRLLAQKWLNNIDGPRIFFNNLKTMSYLSKMGYDPLIFVKYKNWFWELAFSDFTYLRSKKFMKNLLIAMKYMKYYWKDKSFYKKFLPEFLFQKKSKNEADSVIDYRELDVFVLTYNRADYLRIMLDSLCTQTIQGFTIKVLDNASTDDTAEMIQELQTKYPQRKIVHIVHEKNIGNPGNFKKSQELAQNKYTAVFHDDDVVHPEYLEVAMNLFGCHPNAVMASCFYSPMFNPSNDNWNKLHKVYYLWGKDDMPTMSLLIERLCFASIIYRTDAYKSVEYHPEKYGKIFDNPFLLEMGTKGESIFVADIGLRYRQHSGSDSNNAKTGPFLHELISALVKTKELLKTDHYAKQMLLHNFAKLLFDWARMKSVSWDEFIAKCIEAEIFTVRYIKLHNNTLVRRFIFKRNLRKMKKYFLKKTFRK